MSNLSILDTTLDDVTEARPLPGGEYLAIVKGYEVDVSAKKQTPFADIEFRIQEPLSGQDMTGVTRKTVFYKMYITQNNLPYVKADLKALGASGAGSVKDQLEEIREKTAKIVVKISTRNGREYAEVDGIAAA